MPCEQVHCRDARCMSCWQKFRVVSVYFTQPFQYFQIVNLVDCMSIWYKFIMNEAHGGEFENFIIRPHITRCWRITCRLTKATNTFSEYVILIAFPRQQWLHERAPVYVYTYIDCLANPSRKADGVEIFSSFSQPLSGQQYCCKSGRDSFLLHLL